VTPPGAAPPEGDPRGPVGPANPPGWVRRLLRTAVSRSCAGAAISGPTGGGARCRRRRGRPLLVADAVRVGQRSRAPHAGEELPQVGAVPSAVDGPGRDGHHHGGVRVARPPPPVCVVPARDRLTSIGESDTHRPAGWSRSVGSIDLEDGVVAGQLTRCRSAHRQRPHVYGRSPTPSAAWSPLEPAVGRYGIA
jgi:hypothetical protein